MREFGPKRRTTAVREPFALIVTRDGEEERHEFVAVIALDAAGLAHVLTSTEKHPERSLPGMFGIIAKMLDNKDGTPSKWQPTPMPPKDDDDPDQEPRFRAPDGSFRPLSEADKFTEFEAGSSRRRWLTLMDPESDDVVVHVDAVSGVFEHLIAMASGRPTQPPA